MTLYDEQKAYESVNTTALEYLSGRGITASTAKEFGVGFCETTGPFSGRLTIPCYSVDGDLTGFGARTLGDDKPKWINSSESQIYRKSRQIYALDKSRDYILKSGVAIACEGYFDVMALWQAGIRNVVATCGTSFSKHQLRLLKRFSERVIVCYDGDNAGVIAAQRAVEGLTEEKHPISYVRLPVGIDPDDFVRQRGKDEFLKLVNA